MNDWHETAITVAVAIGIVNSIILLCMLIGLNMVHTRMVKTNTDIVRWIMSIDPHGWYHFVAHGAPAQRNPMPLSVSWEIEDWNYLDKKPAGEPSTPTQRGAGEVWSG